MPCRALAGADETIVVHNDPPLTRGMIDRYTRFLEWLFDLDLSPAEETMLERFMVRHWTLAHTADMHSILRVLEADRTILARYPSPAERALVREQMLTPILHSSRALAGHDAEMRWLLDIYDRTHQPVVATDPPLTARAVRAQVDLLVFLMRESGIAPGEIDTALLQQLGDELIARYPHLDEPARRAVCDAPRRWAAVQFVWQESSAAVRDRYRAAWAAVARSRLDDRQQRILAAMTQARAILNAIPAAAAPSDILPAADRLDELAVTLDISDKPLPAIADVLRATALSLRTATSAAAGQTTVAISRSDDPTSATLLLQANLHRVQREHQAAMRLHCPIPWFDLWPLWRSDSLPAPSTNPAPAAP